MDKFLKRKVEDKPSNDNNANENNNNVKESKTEKEDQPAKKQKNSETKEEDDETPIEKSLTLPLADLKDADSFDAEFQKIAQFLLNEVTLMINGKPHRISEIEFYFTSKTHHDPFTHCEADQETCANFYFHKTNGSYRGGTYKGMDVTIGQGDKDVGGILIRSIEALDGSKFVCGPCLCVNHILELNKAGDNVGGFVSKHLKDDISVEKKDGSVLYLKRSKSMPQKKIYRSPRVGLHMTKKGEDKELQKKFVFKNYRFFTDPDKIKKGNSLMIAAMHHAGLTNQQIATILKARPPTVEKWVDLFEEGKKKGEADSYFGKKLSDDDIAKAIGALNQHL